MSMSPSSRSHRSRVSPRREHEERNLLDDIMQSDDYDLSDSDSDDGRDRKRRHDRSRSRERSKKENSSSKRGSHNKEEHYSKKDGDDHHSKRRESRSPSPKHTRHSNVKEKDDIKRQSSRNTRYFIVKSFSESHLDISKQNRVWATQRHNEIKFADAFRRGDDVMLIFSVNLSRHFQGYAQMTSLPGEAEINQDIWVDNVTSRTPWTANFNIKWIRLSQNLPFTSTEHLINPFNENKPVKISRDGQELPRELGEALINLINQAAASSTQSKADSPPRRRSVIVRSEQIPDRIPNNAHEDRESSRRSPSHHSSRYSRRSASPPSRTHSTTSHHDRRSWYDSERHITESMSAPAILHMSYEDYLAYQTKHCYAFPSYGYPNDHPQPYPQPYPPYPAPYLNPSRLSSAYVISAPIYHTSRSQYFTPAAQYSAPRERSPPYRRGGRSRESSPDRSTRSKSSKHHR